MHGGVKTSPGTAEERSYRRFISGTLEINVFAKKVSVRVPGMLLHLLLEVVLLQL